MSEKPKIDNAEQARQMFEEKTGKLFTGERDYFFSDQYDGYCRNDTVKQFKQWLENYGIDSTKVRIVHTHHLYKHPEKPHHIYTFIWKFETETNLNRPKCVECGSDKVISKGVSWLCKTCGRWFVKKRRGDKPK